MNRNELINTLVSEFKNHLGNFTDQQLQDLESGKLEISLRDSVGQEAGGALAAPQKPTDPRLAAARNQPAAAGRGLGATTAQTKPTDIPRIK